MFWGKILGVQISEDFVTSLLCTLVKLNFAGLNGSDTLFIGTGFLRLVNRNSFNCRQI